MGIENEKNRPDIEDLTNMVLRQMQSGESLTAPNFQAKLKVATAQKSGVGDKPQEKFKERLIVNLRNLPRQEIGINEARVKKFLQINNLRQCEYFVINTRDIPREIQKIMNPNTALLGMYISELDVVLLLADRIRETPTSAASVKARLFMS